MNVSKDNYIGLDLRHCDQMGFCAAGIIPYFMQGGERYFLLIQEERNSVWAWNAIGGKREPKPGLHYGVDRLETYTETAHREFREECVSNKVSPYIRDVVLKNHHNAVFWSGKAKMALVLVEVEPMMSGLVYKWWSLNNPDLCLHPFAKDILSSINRVIT